ncbi:hypothetical protein PAHAL_2G113700 [Panicum hallii]|uniref:Uncharacterized protein n=1 Tax=Panicum hallii TaxID=206008 RepID=A0A2S3GXX7_9POAL|nr:hypothetical protein PAHAL_2G113700 [Panicum hallii]
MSVRRTRWRVGARGVIRDQQPELHEAPLRRHEKSLFPSCNRCPTPTRRQWFVFYLRSAVSEEHSPTRSHLLLLLGW